MPAVCTLFLSEDGNNDDDDNNNNNNNNNIARSVLRARLLKIWLGILYTKTHLTSLHSRRILTL